MKYFTAYIYTIILVKIVFISLSLTHVYLKIKKQETSVLDRTVVFWKERVEFVFVFLMACLLIYLFAPITNKGVEVTGETKIVLYLFGVILLITAKWEEFFKETPIFMRIQNIIGVNE